MTQANMVEYIKLLFPEYGESFINTDLTSAMKAFALRTLITRKSLVMTTTSSPAFSYSTVEYSLPTDTHLVYDIELKDSNGNSIDDTVWYKITDDDKLTFLDESGNRLTALPSNIASIVIWYNTIPTAVTDIPDHYHDAVIESVLAKYHRRKGNAQASVLSENVVNSMVVMAKKEANSHKKKGNYFFRKDDM